MEEKCWKQFLETGNILDYLAYKDNLEREETRESDYSDGNGAASITYR
jgi:hypothetical protein